MKNCKKKTLGQTVKRSWSHSASVSQLINVGAIQTLNKELSRNNRKLAAQLQESLYTNYVLDQKIKDYNKDANRVMFARLKVKEMANSVVKLVSDMTEVTQYLDGTVAVSSDIFENSPSNYKLNVKAPNVSCIEEVSVLSSASAVGTTEGHIGAPKSSEESSNRKCSKDNIITPEIQSATSDDNLNISADMPSLLFIGDPGEKSKNKSSSGKSSKKSHMIEALSLTPKLELDLDILNFRRTSSRRQIKNFSSQSKRTYSKKRSTTEKCVSSEEQVTPVNKMSGDSLSASKKDQSCNTGQVSSCKDPDINNEACHNNPLPVVENFPAKLAEDQSAVPTETEDTTDAKCSVFQKVKRSDMLNFSEKNKQPVKSKIVHQQKLMQDSDKGTSDCLAKTLVKSDKKVASKADDKQKVESSDALNFPEKNKQPTLPKIKIVPQQEFKQVTDKGASDCLAKTLVKSNKEVSSKTGPKKKFEVLESLTKQLQLPSTMCSEASVFPEQLRDKSKSKKNDLNSENNQISKEQMPHSVSKETKLASKTVCELRNKSKSKKDDLNSESNQISKEQMPHSVSKEAKLASKAVCEADFPSDILTEALNVPDQTEQQLNVHADINKSGKQVKDGVAIKRRKGSQQEMPLINERESDDFQLENIKPVARKKTKLFTENVKENIMSSDHPASDVSLNDLQVESSDLKPSCSSKKTQNKRKKVSQASSGNIIRKKVRNSIVPRSVESSPVLKDLANMEGVESNTRSSRRSKVTSYKEIPLKCKLRRP